MYAYMDATDECLLDQFINKQEKQSNLLESAQETDSSNDGAECCTLWVGAFSEL